MTITKVAHHFLYSSMKKKSWKGLAENTSFCISLLFHLLWRDFLRFFKCSEFKIEIEVASILLFLFVLCKAATLYYFELLLVRLELFYLSKSKCNELLQKSVKLLNYTQLSLLSSVGMIFKATLERARFCSEWLNWSCTIIFSPLCHNKRCKRQSKEPNNSIGWLRMFS